MNKIGSAFCILCFVYVCSNGCSTFQKLICYDKFSVRFQFFCIFDDTESKSKILINYYIPCIHHQ